MIMEVLIGLVGLLLIANGYMAIHLFRCEKAVEHIQDGIERGFL